MILLIIYKTDGHSLYIYALFMIFRRMGAQMRLCAGAVVSPNVGVRTISTPPSLDWLRPASPLAGRPWQQENFFKPHRLCQTWNSCLKSSNGASPVAERVGIEVYIRVDIMPTANHREAAFPELSGLLFRNSKQSASAALAETCPTPCGRYKCRTK